MDVCDMPACMAPHSVADFAAGMDRLFPDGAPGREARLAVAVSGGPDSMALVWLLSQWAQAQPGRPGILALTVDHGLRPEASDEAAQVGAWLAGWPGVEHRVLRWEGEKPRTRIQEAARAARYRLLVEVCRAEGVRYLMTAHQQDDQAETVLFRLAKGSGLDGLGGMRPVQEAADGVILVRPLLHVPKAMLELTCRVRDLPFVEDPSNSNDRFARARLRRARAALEAEGLNAARLFRTAERLARASDALDSLAARALTEARGADGGLMLSALSGWPVEVAFRAVLAEMQHVAGGGDYGPRLNRAEALILPLLETPETTAVSLGGVVVRCLPAKDRLFVVAE